MAGIAAKADHLLQGVIRHAGQRDHRIAMLQHGRKGQIQSVGTGHDLRTDQGIFAAQDGREDLLQFVPAGVVVAVAVDVGEIGVGDLVFNEGGKDPFGIDQADPVEFIKNVLEVFIGFFI